jgi:hypothetical protein
MTATWQGQFFADYQGTTAVPASNSVIIFMSRGLTTNNVAGALLAMPLPDLLLPPGTIWTITALGIQAGDQISGLFVTGEAYPLG